MMTQPHLALTEAPVGRRVRIKHLHSQPEICTRLRDMGFCENAIIRCVMKADGNIICEICNTRIGLNSYLANSILVSAFE